MAQDSLLPLEALRLIALSFNTFFAIPSSQKAAYWSKPPPVQEHG